LLKNRVSDSLAGLSLAGLLLPSAVAYAGIAGLAPQHAIFATIAGLTIYAFTGRSRFAAVAPTSSSAAIIAASVTGLASVAPDAQLTATLAIVLLAGIWFLLAGFFKLGFIADFISRPVLRGFGLGLAITIIIKQLPALTGVPTPHGTAPFVLFDIIAAHARCNLPSLAIGLAAIALLIAASPFKALPRAFAVLCAGTYAAYTLHLQSRGVTLVGDIDFASLHLTMPQLGYEEWLRIGSFSVPVFLMIYAESWGSIRGLALAHNDPIDADVEMRALGAANILSALCQGMPVGAGLSASSANEAAGAQSRLAGLAAAICIAAFILLGGKLIALIPQPVLAAIVIVSLLHSLDPRPILKLAVIERDFTIAAAAAIAVLGAGVLNGMLTAIGLSLAVALIRFAQPSTSELGEMPDGYNFAAIANNSEAKRLPATAIFRPNRTLFFANAARALAEIFKKTASADFTHIIVSLEETPDLDSTAADEILEFAEKIKVRGQTLILARVKDEVREILDKVAAPAIPSFTLTRSVNDAAILARKQLGQKPASSE